MEQYKVQSEIRERRKKFRLYNELFTCYRKSVENYVVINADSYSDAEIKTEIASENYEPVIENEDSSESKQNIIVDKASNLTEKAFLDWMISNGDVSYTTAEQYISNIHSIEKLYQTIYGVRKNILGAASADNVRTMIETLIQRSEYIDANDRRHNSFSASLNKFAQFAGISMEGFKNPSKKKNYQPPTDSETFVTKTVDFDNPHNCTYYKPCSFILNDSKYSVRNWCELYTQFLLLLYNDNVYSEKIKGMIGKSLYGHRIDFADKTLSHYLRKPIRVSSHFFAEGNLSAKDIIKHIKYIMELCSIDNDHMIIEYNGQKKNDEIVATGENSNNTSEDYELPSIPAQTVADNVIKDSTTYNPEKIAAKPTSEPSIKDEVSTPVSFTPDTTKPFVLKDALIEILSSDAPKIIKHKKYKNGISSKVLCDLLKEYYGKTIGLFEISKLLMMDKTFQSVGKRCYALNTAMISQECLASEQKPTVLKKEKDEILPQEEIKKSPDFPVLSSADLHFKRLQAASEDSITIEIILNIIAPPTNS